MNQMTIGGYIAKKRREENLTQEQLAEMLEISNKTISKWENGKCMPDYSIIQELCDYLHITISELMDVHDKEERSNNTHTDKELLDLLRRIQELENQKNILYGLVLIVFGIACGAMSKTTGGTHVQDFVSGILMGISVAVILVGIWTVGKQLTNK